MKAEIEMLQNWFKSHFMAGFITKSGDELADNLIASIQTLLKAPQTLQSVCRTHSE